MGFFSDRRNRIVEGCLRQMIADRRSEADVPHLYFEAACQYAIDSGGKRYDDMRDSIIFDKIIDGENYSVFFLKGRHGSGTNITLKKRASSKEISAENAEAFVRNAQSSGSSMREPSYPSWAIDRGKAREFADTVLKRCHERGASASFLGTAFDGDLGNMVWKYAAIMEDEGRSFEEQLDGVVGLVVSGWEKLDASKRAAFVVADIEGFFGTAGGANSGASGG